MSIGPIYRTAAMKPARGVTHRVFNDVMPWSKPAGSVPRLLSSRSLRFSNRGKNRQQYDKRWLDGKSFLPRASELTHIS